MTASIAKRTPTAGGSDPSSLLFEKGSPETDIYEKAVAAVIHEQKCTAAFIQKKFMIGFNKAAALIEKMEDDGILSAMNRAGTRKILIDHPSPNEPSSIDTTVSQSGRRC